MPQDHLRLIVTVTDGASSKLKTVEKSLQGTGRAARAVGADFTKFNRIMFSTSAFIGLFTRSFQRATSLITEAAQLGRVQDQFEHLFGPSGEFFRNIRGFTDAGIDAFQAMQSAIEIRNLGLVKSSKQTAEILAMASTAARRMGKDSSFGIQQFTSFLKSGNRAALENLGLLSRSNTAMIAFESILGRAGGTIGRAVTMQARLAIGMRLLMERTRGLLKGQRDLLDVLTDLSSAFKLTRTSVGRFLGEALSPVLDKVTDLFLRFTEMLEIIRKNDKNISFLAKSFVIATSSVAGLLAVIGTLRLSFLALGAIGIGIPLMTTLVGSLAAAFMLVTSNVEGVIEKLRIFGAFIKGTFQLVHSFLSDPKNFAEGIGLIDKELADLLRERRLLGLVKNISRVISIIGIFGKSAKEGFIKGINSILDKLGSFGTAIRKFLGIDSGPWSRSWLETARRLGLVFGQLSARILALVTAFKLLRMGGTILGRIPGVGRVLGGRGPKGTATDPIFTIPVGIPGKGFIKEAGTKIIQALGLSSVGIAFKDFALALKNFITFSGPLSALAQSLWSLTRIATIGAAKILLIVGVVAAAFKGIYDAISNTTDSLMTFFRGIKDLSVSVWNAMMSFEPLKKIVDNVSFALGFIPHLLKDIFNKIAEGFEKIVGWTNIGLGGLGRKFSEWAQEIDNRIEGRKGPWEVSSGVIGKAAHLGAAAGTSGSITSVANPTIPESMEERESRLSRLIESFEEEKRATARQAFIEALGTRSPGGEKITKEEWVNIISIGMDRSMTQQKLANKEEARVRDSRNASRRW